MAGRFPIFVLALSVFALTACGDGGAPSDKDAATGPSASASAVWSHPTDPAKSLTIVTDTGVGLAVRDQSGAVVFENTDGRMTVVDVRDAVSITTDRGLADSAVLTTIVAATNAEDKTIAVYALNPGSAVLTGILDDPIPSNMNNPEHLCLYHSAVNDSLYAFATDRDGTVGQWLLYDSGRGTLRGTIQRRWSVGIGARGCAVDDADGAVFITDARGTTWRYGAEPKDSFTERQKVE